MTLLAPSQRPRRRRPYRVPTMPKGREDWRMGTFLSLTIHIGILLLLIAPFAMTPDIRELAQGAGGPGPAGGGGGGHRGTGGIKAEVLRFVQIAPPEPTPAPTPPKPEVVPPPKIEPTPTVPQVEAPKLPVASPIVGVGGGTGADVAGGTGSGTGGGIGTGVGTGTGSATGPGTGGGGQANHPPTAIEMFIPPLPVPASVRGFHLIAEFDVDETGRVRGLEFTPTRDRGYNRRLREVFEGFRFRPGTRPDGTPIRMKYQLAIDLP